MAEGTNVEGLTGSLNSFMNSLRTKEEEDRDENGNVVASRILDAQGKVLFSDQYTYDESGRRLSHDSFKDGKLKSREESSYDENGFKTTKYFNGDNVPQRIVRLDDKGRQVGLADYDLHGNLKSFSSQTYKENGEENETVFYEISNGKIRITSQSFCDDNGTRHIRSYRNDEVKMSYQTKDLIFPNQVRVPTKDDWSRDRAAAEKYLNDYKAEEAFFKSKPEPKMDAWVASFGEPEKSPVKEEQKAEIAEETKQAEPESRKKDRQMTDSEGYNHLVSYDDDGRVSADKKFDKDGNLIGEGIYENGEFKGSKAYFVDNEGFSHVAVKDVQDRPVSDQKFDKDGNLIGEGIYENGEFKGSKAYFIDNEGFSHVAVKDELDRPVSDQKFDKDGKLAGEGIYENGEFKGSKAYVVKDGVEQVVEYDVNDNVITPAPEKQAEKQTRPVQEERKAEPVEEVKQAEPVQEERKAEPAEEVKQADPEKQTEQVAESDAYVNMITPASEEREEKQAEQAAESDAYVNMITPASEEREEQQADQVFDKDGRLSEQTLYDNLGRVSGSVAYAYSDDGSVSMYTYDVDGQQTGFDSYDAEGHRKFAADFSNGVQQNFVRFDDEGRPTNIELYNEGQPAVSTSIQYDGDAVYKDVRSAEGQLLRSETTRDGRMSIVDYVDQKARAFSFDRGGDVYGFTDYAIQDGKAVKVKDGQFNLSGQEREARFYDADGRVTKGLIRDSEESVTNYSFNEDGSYKESGPNGDKTHRTIRLFGKTVHTPQMPEFSKNTTDEIPLAVDGDNHPQLSERELACFRQGYVEIGEGGSHTGYYSEKLPCMNEEVFRTKLFTQAADRLAQVGGVKRETSNSGAEQSFANTQQNRGAEQTAADNRANDAGEQTAESVVANTAPEQTAENSDNQSDRTSENEDEEVYVAENGNEDEKAKGLGEEDLMKQGKNLQQWINYFGMEGSRAKPPYASPFESIKECRNLKGSALMDLENGNTLINSTNRMELVVRSKEGEKKEPTLEECMTLVRLGQQKGWTSIRITGSPAFQKQMYLACRSLGMPTKDFVPTPEMLKEGAELENAFNSKDKTLPQSAEDTEARNPEMREPTLSERCADLDSRFFALEKIREIQPPRKKTKEDPHPELANFDTIRAAEKEGIRPLTAVEKEPDDLDGKLRVLNKRSKEALEDLKQTEKNRKRALLNEMGADQRNEWRNRLTAVQQKENSGQPLSAEDNRIKAMADKYQINVDPTKEPETRRRIDLEDFDQKNKKAFRKKESMIERTSAFETAVVRREAALNASAMISSESAKLPSKKDLLATARKEWKQIASAHQPVSETLRQIGNINAETATLTERNKKNYNKVTKRNEKNNQQASEASEQRNAFVHAAAQNSR